MMTQIILASASPRRSELLNQLGIGHQIKAVAINETPFLGELPLNYVQRMAAEKSAACAQLHSTSFPILAADTAVILNNKIMGKPENEAHAAQMLRQLSGKTHEVYSAISLRGKQHWQRVSITKVMFRVITECEIKAYWKTTEPADKAGGYAIQGIGSIFIQTITGSFSGVMGLPLFETAEILTEQGLDIIHE
ncbi:MAG: septum formation inhibitor Maf [Methylococcales bacterium]|nr:septum formation inhibitor Maf [Methylococcales bacterium]MCK5925441.1 septum formation inhibitor Maf [Methylococcales bacterium]